MDNMGIFDSLWRGEEGRIEPRPKDADLWIKLWQLLEECGGRMGRMEGNEMVDELARDGTKRCTRRGNLLRTFPTRAEA